MLLSMEHDNFIDRRKAAKVERKGFHFRDDTYYVGGPGAGNAP